MTAARGGDPRRARGVPAGPVGRFGGEAALSVEARYLEPQLPIELDDAYRQTFERLRRQFRARGCTPEEAADLAQEAAVRAFVHIRRWGVSGDGLDPLLNRIARNLLIDRYRRTTPHLVPLDSAGEIHDPDQDPSEEVERRQRRSAVQRAIRSLPTRHRAAITFSLSGLTPEEVGNQMGIGRNAADALLHRARRSLKEHLSAVREGAWGIAFGVRMKWDRLTRRSGIDASLADASGLAFAHTAVSLATAAVMAVMSVGAGGGGNVQVPSIGRAVVPVAAAQRSEASTVPPATSADVGAGDVTATDTTDGTYSYRLGPTEASWSDKGFDHNTNIGDDGNGTPLLGGHGYLYRNDGTVSGPKADVGLIATRNVCNALPSLCHSGVKKVAR